MQPKTINRASSTAARNKVYIESEIDSEIFSIVESAAKDDGITVEEWMSRALEDGFAALKS